MIKKSPLYIQSKNNYIRKRTTVNCRETNTYISGKEDLCEKHFLHKNCQLTGKTTLILP